MLSDSLTTVESFNRSRLTMKLFRQSMRQEEFLIRLALVLFLLTHLEAHHR